MTNDECGGWVLRSWFFVLRWVAPGRERRWFYGTEAAPFRLKRKESRALHGIFGALALGIRAFAAYPCSAARVWRTRARARKARTLTSGRLQPVRVAISATVFSSRWRRERTRRSSALSVSSSLWSISFASAAVS